MKVSSIEPLEARIAPAVLTISPVAPSTDEGSTVGSTTNVQFKITLDVIEAQDVTVLATAFSGSAVIGQDLSAFSQTIIVPKGQLETIFSVPITQDKLIEGDETFTVKLSSPSANAFLGAAGTETATATIANDDKPTLTLEPATTPVVEGSTLNGTSLVTFKIKLDQRSAEPITVTAQPKDGTATIADGDFNGSGISLTIPADVLEYTFTVPVLHDTKVEGTETFSVELIGTPTNAFIGNQKTATATITDDDTPSIKIVDATVLEGAQGETTQLRFKVQLSGHITDDVTFDWVTAAGTATGGVDFTNISTAIHAVIPLGQTELELVVDVTGDNLDERDETLSAFIDFAKMGSAPLTMTDKTAVGTIKNDEVTVSLNGPGTITEGNPTTDGPTITNANYTLSLSGPSNHDILVELEIVDGTAKRNSDFTLPTLSITIPANSVNPGTITVPIKIDQIFEGDETFEVRIKSVTDATTGASTSVTTTILNDDTKPTLSVVAATVAEGNDPREVQVTVKLDGATEGPVTFDWSTVNGLAIAGLDFEAVSNQTATIAAGATSTTLVLKLLGDTLWEGNETLNILLSNVSANAAITPGSESGTVTIDENQSDPTLTIADVSRAENGGTMTFVVSMPEGIQTSENITFDWTAAFGTATAGVDYSATPTTVTIPAGQTSATFTVTLLDDAVLESDETFQVTIGNATFRPGGPSPVTIPIGDAQATARIINDERQVSISTGTLVVPEQNGLQGETPSLIHYVITLTDALGNPTTSDSPVTVTLARDAVASTAEAGDITLPSNLTVTIPAGQTSVGFDVTVKGDVVFEGDEVLVMKIADSTNASVRTGSASTTITDEEVAPHLFIDDVKIAEGDSGIVVRKVKVKLTSPAEQAITFDWSTENGTALSSEDYTRQTSGKATIPAGATEVEIDVVLSGDTVNEGDEHFFINISNAVMGEATPVTVDDAQGKVTIQNDEAIVRIAGASITEGDAGDSNLVFNISLAQASIHPVTVTLALGAQGDTATLWTAETGGDYKLPTLTVTIPAGQTVATFAVPIVGDTLSEALETFTVKITDSVNATVATPTATGTIVDSDTPPVLSINDLTFVEGNSGTTTYAFTIALSAVSGQDVKVLVTPTPGTATMGAADDFTGLAKLITIPAGQLTTSVTFDVLVNGDTRYENDETFSVVLSNATGASVSATDGTGTGTILNDDPKPTLTIGSASIDEGNSGTRQLTFEVKLSAKSNLPVTFKAFTSNGTAIAGTDYVARAEQEFTIPAGQDTFMYTVTLTGDTFYEQAETFTVNLKEVTGADVANGDGTASATATIVNDDAQPTISIADLTVSEGDSGTKEIEVTVALSSLAGDPVTFDWSLPAGATAILGDDFNTVTTPGTITINPGQNTAKIKFSVVGDTINEVDESFSVQIANAKAGSTVLTSTKDTATVKLRNDEIKINILDQSVVAMEGDSGTSTIGFKVVVSGTPLPNDDVTVTVNTQDATARSTGEAGVKDFDAIANQVLTFSPTSPREQTVFVTIHGDTSFDSIDQFRVLLSNATNATIVDGEATGTITEETTESRPVLNIVADQTRVENADEATTAGKTAFTYTVSMDRYSDEPVSAVFATVPGTATAGSDFNALNQTITFTAGSALSQTVTVEVLNDSLYEAEETFKVELNNPLNATLGVKERNGTIQVDGDAAPTLKVGAVSIVEGDPSSTDRFLEFVVQRTGATGTDLSFTFSTLDATGDEAVAGVDYEALTQTVTMTPNESSKTVKVKLLPDVSPEQDETFSVQLSSLVGATLAAPADGTAKGTILDDDIKVSISPGVYEVVEGNAGQSDLVFNVELSAASTFPTTITFTVAPGTATNSGTRDFENPMVLNIVIPAGSTTGQIRVPVFGDITAEPDETLSVTLTGATNAELAATNTTATGTILNDDASLIISDGQIVEGANGTANMVFTVSLKDATAFPVTVHYTTSNSSATAGSDYTLTQGDLAFVVGGPTDLQILVPVSGDTTPESHETFLVTLSAASGATILDAEATGTILDDDNAHLSIGDVSIQEGDAGQQNLVFTVTLSGTHAVPVTVDYKTVDGTAKSAGPLLDYLAQNGTLTFDPNESTKTISIPILGDNWKELAESFSVKLSNARLGESSSGIFIDDDSGSGQILDDGDATLGVIVNNGRVVEGAAGATAAMTFSIETTAPATETITLKANTRAGSAGATDFTGLVNQTITIAAGTSTSSVTVNVTGDTLFEDSEFFYLDVSEFGTQAAPVDGSVGRSFSFGVILNDDINIINGREFEYVDKDGDLVHVKFSKGTLSVPTSGAGTNANDISFVLDSALGGRTIQLINLSDDALEFEGASITITANPQILVTGEVLGTGKTQVGAIETMQIGENIFSITSGVGLGTVKIDGDLGRLITGSFRQINGVRNLEVDSMGTGESLPNAQVGSTTLSIVFGPIGRMHVHGDFLGTLAVVGDSPDQPFPGGIGKIGTLVIDGLLKGGTASGSGQITFTSSIGNATIGGIVGGAGDGSGVIVGLGEDFRTSIGKLNVLGDIVGGAGPSSGAVLSLSKIGSVSVGKFGTGDNNIEGNILGGGGNGSGRIDVQEIGSLSVNGDIKGGTGQSSGFVNGTKAIGSARVAGDLIGGSAQSTGAIVAGVLKGKLAVEGSVKGGSGAASGLISVAGYTSNFLPVDGNAGSIVLGKAGVSGSGNLIGGDGDNSGKVFIDGNIKSFLAYGNLDATGAKGSGVAGLDVAGSVNKAVIKGSILGGTSDMVTTTNRPIGSAFVSANQIGTLIVEGNVKSGVKGTTSPATQSSAFSAGIHSNSTIKTLKILGGGDGPAIAGNKDVPVVISAIGKIGNVTIGGDVEYAEILSGYNRTADFTKSRGVLLNAGATIDSVTVNGNWKASSLVAGVYAGADGKFGTADDAGNVNGTANAPLNQDLVSRIAKVVITGVISDAPSEVPTDASYAIVSEYLKSVRVNGSFLPLQKGAKNDNRATDPGSDKTQIFEIL